MGLNGFHNSYTVVSFKLRTSSFFLLYCQNLGLQPIIGLIVYNTSLNFLMESLHYNFDGILFWSLTQKNNSTSLLTYPLFCYVKYKIPSKLWGTIPTENWLMGCKQLGYWLKYLQKVKFLLYRYMIVWRGNWSKVDGLGFRLWQKHPLKWNFVDTNIWAPVWELEIHALRVPQVSNLPLL